MKHDCKTMDIATWIDRHATFTPHKAALRFAAADISYAALARRIAALAAGLAAELGIGRGDRIAHLGLNSPHMLALLFACARLGAILVPINWRLSGPEIAAILADCEPVALFAGDEFRSLVDDPAFPHGSAVLVALSEADPAAAKPWRTVKEMTATPPAAPASDPAGPDDPLLIVYTSGTTGRPKGAVLTQRAVLMNAVNSIHMHAMCGDDVILSTLPMFHVGGLNIQTLPALHIGATVVLHDRFDAVATIEAIDRERPSLTVLVPAQLNALFAEPRWQEVDLSCLRAISTGSTIIPERLIRAVHDRGVPLIQVYGSTETGPIAAYLTIGDAEAGLGSAGKTALHNDIRIVNEAGKDVATGCSGEILVRGENVMTAYWRDPEASRAALADGWFHSGDIGHFDSRGFLYIDDRKKEVVISGGENIYPAELENILADCPQIREAAVVGRADDRWGEVAVAIVVLTERATMTDDDVRRLFEGRLARFKHPRDIVFLDALPRNAMGKVNKDAVRALLAARAAGEAGQA